MSFPAHPVSQQACSLPWPLVLASASPRRRELLAQWGLPALVIAAEVEELEDPNGDPASLTAHNARLKLDAVRASHPEACVLAADTVVSIDSKILGKPRDAAEAREMLSKLSGREHQVYSALAATAPGQATIVCVAVSSVQFAELGEEQVTSYLAGDVWCDKAGAYALQEDICGFVTSVVGERETVIGLSRIDTLATLSSLANSALGAPGAKGAAR